MVVSAFATLTLSTSILVMATILFSMLRKKYKNFYMPKIFSREPWAPREGGGYFGWIMETLIYPESKLLANTGVDSVLYLKFLKYCIYLLFTLSLMSCSVLLPINRFGQGANEASQELMTSFDAFSVANLPQGSHWLFAHLLTVFLFSILTYICIYRLHHSSLSVEVFNSQYKYDSIQNRTVLVTSIPGIIRSDQQLENFFKEMFGETKVVAALMVPASNELHTLAKVREQTLGQWQQAHDQYLESNQTRRPVLLHPTPSQGTVSRALGHVACFPVCQRALGAGEVDAIQYYEKELEILDHEIAVALQSRPVEYSSTGFVTFDSVATAMMCAQSLLHSHSRVLRATLAPAPGDINWDWFTRHKTEIHIKLAVMFAGLTSLFLFWSVPVTAVQAVSNLDDFSQIPGIGAVFKFATRSATLAGIIQGILPSLALSCFLVLLPFIIKFILSIHHFLLNTQWDRALLRAHWLFLVHVFLVGVVVGSIFHLNAAASQVWEKPSTIFEMLASSVPTQALRLTNYLVFEGFAGYPMIMLCRPDDFIILKIKQWFFCKTQREKASVAVCVPFDFPIQYARELFIFTIALSYSSLNPLVLPCATVYLALAYLTAKYNFMYVMPNPYQGRKMTPLVIDRIIFTLLLYQCLMLGVFTLKLFPAGSSVTLLIILTGVFRWYMTSRFYLSSKFLPLKDCPKKSKPAINTAEEMRDLYLNPCFKPPKPIVDVEIADEACFAVETKESLNNSSSSANISLRTSTNGIRSSLSLHNNSNSNNHVIGGEEKSVVHEKFDLILDTTGIRKKKKDDQLPLL